MVKKCRHKLLDILIIAVCATIANADSWDEIALFGQGKISWLKQWLELPGGIPSADTFRRVFGYLDGQQFELCFIDWVQQAFTLTDGQVIAIDGKTARGTCDKTGQGGLHVVSAWASANRLTLAQAKVASKGHEIVAIPALLQMLNLEGCTVTIDALGCQKKVVNAIREQPADYVLSVKGNQPTLYRAVQDAFAAQDTSGWADRPQAVTRTEKTAHGRHELRQAWALPDSQAHRLGWRDCQSLLRIERTSTFPSGKVRHKIHYYISSRQPDAPALLAIVRHHWGIENRCHWLLDVVFHEDANRNHFRNANHNLTLLRKIALNLLRQLPSKGTLKGKRYQAALNEDFLASVLNSSFNLMR